MAEDTKPPIVEIAAGDIEAWTNGEDNPMESELGEALIKASESVSRDGKKWTEVHIVIRPDEESSS